MKRIVSESFLQCVSSAFFSGRSAVHPSLPPGTQPTCTDLHCALRIRSCGRITL